MIHIWGRHLELDKMTIPSEMWYTSGFTLSRVCIFVLSHRTLKNSGGIWRICKNPQATDGMSFTAVNC